MEFPGSHIIFRIVLGLASFIYCWIAVGWFRQTRECGERARRGR
jgi:hypothetical protein